MKKDPRISELVAAVSPAASHIVLAGLKGSAPAYLLARLMESLTRPLLIITPDSERADEIYAELCFYSAAPEAIALFPSWDTAPFDNTSPHPDVVGQRLSTLSRLMDGKVAAIVVPLAAACQRVLPHTALGACSQYLMAGEEADRERLLTTLANLGYCHVPLVEDRSTFAVRGGIVDVFPPNLQQPVRIEFFGDFVDTIRSFDPVTQRSMETRQELVILPAKEILFTGEVLKEFAGRLKLRCDDLELPPAKRRELLEQLQSGIYPPGIEYLQPLFHPGLETIFDYTGPESVTVLIDPASQEEEKEQILQELAIGERRAVERDQIISRRDDLFLTTAEFSSILASRRQIIIPALEISSNDDSPRLAFRCEETRELKVDLSGDSEGVLKPLTDRLSRWLKSGERIIIACHQRSQLHRLYELLAPHALPVNISERNFPAERHHQSGKVELMIGGISRGFRFPDESLVVIAEEEIFGKRVKRRGISEARKRQLLTSLAELKSGDYMVHVDFGVGVYRGLQHLAFAGIEGDFLVLEYAGEDRLYLPVDRLNLVQRYVGAEGIEPKVDKLGGSSWEKAKARAKAAVQEMAEELLRIYAARQIQEGHVFSPPGELYREFEAAFTYEETPDQQAAIDDVLADMTSNKPMDRLVCGDVGYGKTEVAMRGAFQAIIDGKQVAVLVPTTILAQQHLETFRSRFSGYPVQIEMLSRFRSAKEQKTILQKVEKGEVDIVIGTHRLLQKDVAFRDLGLLIVDEEQRFGVSHKERLKKLRAVVDILTLTATPIPRTLHMSLMGIRDLSIIDTPPVDRLAIKTFVARFSDEVIREAVLREIRRGGQVFFVHNRVQSIGAMHEHLQRVVPEARIAVAHGQMDEKTLETVMMGFMHGETNLLLSTTIIESGLDIPTANTLIVNRADTFGLSQLYQLRGRVGRSRQRAFAYFLIPGEGAISSDARERLRILQEISELGAGFRIATHDLEIRGAGDLLGAKQSGNIAAVGFELYTELMEETIRQMKGEEMEIRVDPELKLRIPAFIPEEYVKNPNQRLIIYKKLTQAANEEETDEVMAELVDRFGTLPLAAVYLIEVMKLRLSFKKLLIREAEFDGKRLSLAFHERTPASPDKIIALMRENPKKYSFSPDFRLSAEIDDTSFDGVLTEARNLLKRVG